MNIFYYNLGVSLAHFSSAKSQIMTRIKGQNVGLVGVNRSEVMEKISELGVGGGSNGHRDGMIGMFDEIIRLRDIERDYLLTVIHQLEEKVSNVAI